MTTQARQTESTAPARWGAVGACLLAGIIAAGHVGELPPAALTAAIVVVNGILVQSASLAQFVGPAALVTVAARFGRWESALWTMVGASVALIALALLMHRQEKLQPTRGTLDVSCCISNSSTA